MFVTVEDLPLGRLLLQAQFQACKVVQDIKTRHIILLPLEGYAVVCTDVAAARSWLRLYANCGLFARRCFVAGEHVCSVHVS